MPVAVGGASSDFRARAVACAYGGTISIQRGASPYEIYRLRSIEQRLASGIAAKFPNHY